MEMRAGSGLALLEHEDMVASLLVTGYGLLTEFPLSYMEVRLRQSIQNVFIAAITLFVFGQVISMQGTIP